MSILDKRKGISEAVIKDRFIREQLQEESKEIEKAQSSIMTRRGFSQSEWWSRRSFKIDENKMEYTHMPRHRFVDMKTRNTTRGKIKKKNHPVHNRIMFGHANNIIKRLHYGLTEAVKEEMMKDI